MIKVHHLTSQYVSATNISHPSGMKTEFVEKELTPQSSQSALRSQLKLEMVNSFLNFNLQPLCHVLYCIKHCDAFTDRSVYQEMYPAPPAIQCRMKIIFSADKSKIQVRIYRQNNSTISNTSRCTSKEASKLLQVISYLEEIYADADF